VNKRAAAARPEEVERTTAAAVQQEGEEERRAAVVKLRVPAAVQLPEASQERVGLARAFQGHLPENRTSRKNGRLPTFYCRIGHRTYQLLLVTWKTYPIIGTIEEQARREWWGSIVLLDGIETGWP
jgi:hypothetical protein